MATINAFEWANEYSSVKVIIKNGDVEVVYDIPMVKDFMLVTNYDGPTDYIPLIRRQTGEKVKDLEFVIVPLSNDEDTYMTVTKTTRANTTFIKDD